MYNISSINIIARIYTTIEGYYSYFKTYCINCIRLYSYFLSNSLLSIWKYCKRTTIYRWLLNYRRCLNICSYLWPSNILTFRPVNSTIFFPTTIIYSSCISTIYKTTSCCVKISRRMKISFMKGTTCK